MNNMNSSQLDCSIIVPVYYNAPSIIETFYKVKLEVIDKNPEKLFQVIFVDDGSGDNSYEILTDLKSKYSSIISLIKLTRNFGQVSAILAGLHHASGKSIVIISADLQDPPELINQMLDGFFKENYKLVIATRESRDESYWRKKTSNFFYWLMKKLNFESIPVGGFDYFLFSAEIRNHLINNFEANIFLQGNILWLGYQPKFLHYRRETRKNGKSKWTFSKKLKYMIDGVLGYTYLPIRLMSFLGLVIFIIGLLYALIILISYFLNHTPFKGWAPLMIVVLILSGIQLLFLGIIGEYLWRTLDQVRGRPHYIVEKIEN
jgi:polyisoprenyl-phosphate glycosyltransferase